MESEEKSSPRYVLQMEETLKTLKTGPVNVQDIKAEVYLDIQEARSEYTRRTPEKSKNRIEPAKSAFVKEKLSLYLHPIN